MLFYRAALPLARKTLNYVSGIIRRHRKSIGSRWRKLNSGRQALLVLAYLRKARRSPSSRPGSGSARPLPGGMPGETVALLAARAPKLRRAVPGREGGRVRLRGPGRNPHPIDRVAADGHFYSGKHTKHGMNLQVIASLAETSCGSSELPRIGPRQEGRVDLGRPGRAGGRRPGHAGR